ncbi:MAG: hypothetical protein ABIR79_11070 [Candidatus Binatia bacterium]
MPTRLYDLIDRLMGTSLAAQQLRRQFHDDPESLTKELSSDSRLWLYKMDKGKISQHVQKEYQEDLVPTMVADEEYKSWDGVFSLWPFPKNEFPINDLPDECLKAGVQYPNPIPKVHEITPSNAAKAGGLVPVDVTGQGFVMGRTTLELYHPSGPIKLQIDKAVNAPRYFRGTFRCAHVHAIADLSTATAGTTYEVRVTIDCKDGKTVSVPSTITFAIT